MSIFNKQFNDLRLYLGTRWMKETMYMYLDLIWLLNFGIDYLLLWMTAVFRNAPFRRWRMALAAALGASYVLFLFFPPLHTMYTLFMKVGLSVVLILLTFGYGNWQRFVSLFCTFYFISFVTGGGIFALHYVWQSQHEVMQGVLASQGNAYGHAISWWFVILGFPIMLWFSHTRWKKIEISRRMHSNKVWVDVCIDQKWFSCQGLIDTGNQLHDPFTRTPVMLMDLQVAEAVLPSALNEAIKKDSLWDLQHSIHTHISDEWLSRIKIVPFRGVGRQMDLMLTVRPDRVLFRKEECTWKPTRVLVAFKEEILSSNKEYEAIVHPDLLLPEYESPTNSNKEAM